METLKDAETTAPKAVDEEMVQKLSEGVVGLFHPPLKSLKGQLVELVKKQEFLTDEMHSQNMKLAAAIYDNDLHEMFTKVKLYKEKLATIRKTMMTIHEQSTRLKKRALRLEQQKQKEIVERIEKRDYEEYLVRKPPS